jgi:hypothetical protein
MVVVAVRLVGDPFRRAEVNTARYWASGVVVQHPHVDPVASRLNQLDPDAIALG